MLKNPGKETGQERIKGEVDGGKGRKMEKRKGEWRKGKSRQGSAGENGKEDISSIPRVLTTFRVWL